MLEALADPAEAEVDLHDSAVLAANRLSKVEEIALCTDNTTCNNVY